MIEGAFPHWGGHSLGKGFLWARADLRMQRFSLFSLLCAQPVWVAGFEQGEETCDKGLGNQRESVTLRPQCHKNPPPTPLPSQRKKQGVRFRELEPWPPRLLNSEWPWPIIEPGLGLLTYKNPFAFKFCAWPSPCQLPW